ncbi:conjugal transfer protein [Vibrio cholerae]|nr:conjugal transfer protein [Vibrio cholerae]EII3728478.1 conjugal transfer protein [Vibrio cholerae]ELU3957042.1 conjugal transfer protein [Vibrio cholerae]ELY5192881.1 conjugal transfer protein [Vibrio cholerae]
MQESVITDEVKNVNIPQGNSDNAKLRAERNRWFFFCISLVVAVIIGYVLLFFAFVQAQATKEILYVKLERNGGWTVEQYKPQDEQLYFKTTIDSALQSFAISRYKVAPETIDTDWGEASVFMSESLKQEFLDPRRFNALAKKEELKKSKLRVEVKVRNIDHFDNVDWSFSPESKIKVVKSNVYFTRTVTNNGKKDEPEALVLTVQWHLKPKKEVTKQSNEIIQINPVGVEIVSYELNKERIQ